MVVIGSVFLVGKGSAQSWRNASRAPVGLAPDPAPAALEMETAVVESVEEEQDIEALLEDI